MKNLRRIRPTKEQMRILSDVVSKEDMKIKVVEHQKNIDEFNRRLAVEMSIALNNMEISEKVKSTLTESLIDSIINDITVDDLLSLASKKALERA